MLVCCHSLMQEKDGSATARKRGKATPGCVYAHEFSSRLSENREGSRWALCKEAQCAIMANAHAAHHVHPDDKHLATNTQHTKRYKERKTQEKDPSVAPSQGGD